MKKIIIASMLLLSLNCFADVYMKTDLQGNVTYSDTAIPGGKKITITTTPQNTSSTATSTTTNKPTTNESPDETAAPSDAAAPYSEVAPYTAFDFSSPKDQETITNQQIIPITIKISPLLQKGDKVQLYLDGNAAGSPAPSLTFNLSSVERGKHEIRAVLLDRNNNMVRQTNTITVFVHYGHLGNLSNTNTAAP